MISNSRNATKAVRIDNQPGSTFGKTGSSAINCPATSSTTTLPGSFRAKSFSEREPAQIPTRVTTVISSNSPRQIAFCCSRGEVANELPTQELNHEIEANSEQRPPRPWRQRKIANAASSDGQRKVVFCGTRASRCRNGRAGGHNRRIQFITG